MHTHALMTREAARPGLAPPLRTPALRSILLGAGAQPKLRVGAVDDPAEAEADRVADRIMRMPDPKLVSAASEPPPDQRGILRRKCAHCEEEERVQRKETLGTSHAGGALSPAAEAAMSSLGPGAPLPASERAFFEPRFGHSLGHVKVHDGAQAAHAASAVNARAFALGSSVAFARGEYQPGTRGGRELMAHELAHVRQVRNSSSQTADVMQSQIQPPDIDTSHIQRKLELRPPGKGEASAFPRAQELVDRLNTVSPALQYHLTVQELTYTVKDPSALSHFDNVMISFIDRADVVPLRLITSKGYVDGPLFADDFIRAYVDLDDLLADDIYAFQSDLLHFLTERFQVKDYARLIGTDFFKQFKKSHRAGKDAEAAQLQYLFNDPTIIFVYEDEKPNKTWINAFKSKSLGYWIFQVVAHSNQEIAGGKMWVQRKNGTRATIDEFRKERAPAGP